MQSTVLQVTDLVAVVLLPRFANEPVVEVHYEKRVDEVNESIAHVGLVLLVHRHVNEVVFASLAILIEGVEQLVLGVLVRDVLHHDGGSLFQLVM